MKRRSTLAVLLVLMLTLLAGCGSTTQNDANATNGTQEETTTTDFGSADPNGDGIVGNDGSGTDGNTIVNDTEDAADDVVDGVEDAADDLTGDNDTNTKTKTNRTTTRTTTDRDTADNNPMADDNAR